MDGAQLLNIVRSDRHLAKSVKGITSLSASVLACLGRRLAEKDIQILILNSSTSEATVGHWFSPRCQSRGADIL